MKRYEKPNCRHKNSLTSTNSSSTCNGLFITDLDGTLLNDERRISEKDIATLETLAAQNIVTAIATGRSFYSFNKLIESLQGNESPPSLAIDYVIFSTGAGVMSFPETSIHKSFSLDHEAVLEISAYLEKIGVNYMVQKPVPETNHFIYSSCQGLNPDFQRRIELYRGFAAPLTAQRLNDFGDATQVLCIVPEEQGHEVAVNISHKFKELSVIKATSPLDNESIWIEIFSPDVSKSRASAWLVDRLKLNRSRVCAVGNDYNDEDMLDWAGESYITQNGPALLRDKYINVSSNNQSGVTEAAMSWLSK